VSGIVKASESAGIVQHAQMLDLALRAAAQLKSARGLLPDSLKSEGEIVAVLLAGQELGIPPMTALRSLQVVKGKIVISYDMMIALLRRASYRVEWLTTTAVRAELRLTAPDGSTHVEVWDQHRAQKAGLWGSGTWSKYPETMLRARCVSSAARAFAGEVLAGVYIEDEAREIATPKGAAPVVELVKPADAPRTEPAPAPRSEVEIEDGVVVDVPEKLSECATADEMRGWLSKNRSELAKLKNGRREKAIESVRTNAERLGCEPDVMLVRVGLLEQPEQAL
jgi:hypothetical protein